MIPILAVVTGGCDGGSPTRVAMDFERPDGLYDAPFPSDDLRAGSSVDLSSFPNPEQVTIVEQVRDLLDGVDGFATTGGVFFRLSAPIDGAALPAVADTVSDGSPVFLIDIDPDSPERGRRVPLEVEFEPYGGLYAADNLLSLLPLQGVPLRAHTRYAAGVKRDLGDARGAPLARAPKAALSEMEDAVTALADLGVDGDDLAGLTVFTTGDPTVGLAAVREAALARPLPVPAEPWRRTELFADYCVYETTIEMPDYQAGDPPYQTEGGRWRFDADGAPIFQREEEANLVVTIPRTQPPASGFPLVVFVRTGGGGERPLVDRGRRAEAGGDAVEAGEGPARYLARAGFAGLQVDGPLGGLRNTTGGDEQFLIFNVQNLGAIRDNVRESAVELSVIAHVALDLHLDAGDCTPATGGGSGPPDITFDADHIALMGHSMGATIAPLAASMEPLFGALILSGAGGSWIENIVYKRKPLEVAPVIGLLLNQGFDVRTDDPALTMAQWALEPADPPVYAGSIVRDPPAGAAPRHVLMVQGIVDNYILPNIANATSLSLGLDLAGEELDTADDPGLEGQAPLGPLLSLVGRRAIDLPASENAGEGGGPAATAVVVQHPEDGIEDGHEVLFQTEAPKHQLQCFLSSWLDGVPVVAEPASVDTPCP